MHLLIDCTRSQSADDPLQVQGFEGDQHQTGAVLQVFGALWVHDVMRGSATHVLLEARGGSLVHPGRHEERNLVFCFCLFSFFPPPNKTRPSC